MTKICLIGGGEIIKNETYEIEEFIYKNLVNKESTTVFIGAASNDSKEYFNTFKEYINQFNSNCYFLKLTRGLSKKDKEIVLSADVIYIGGGSTDLLFKYFKESGFDILLKKINTTDKIILGISAGVHILCEFYNDNNITEEKQNILEIEKNIKKGLGILNGFSCEVHFNKYSFINHLYALKNISNSNNILAIEEKSAIILDKDLNIIKVFGNVFLLNSNNKLTEL